MDRVVSVLFNKSCMSERVVENKVIYSLCFQNRISTADLHPYGSLCLLGGEGEKNQS